MEITRNVIMLEIAGRNGFIYPTLIWGDERLILIDGGFPGQTEEITQAITNAGFRACDLTDIILTHQDIDHIGCVSDLLRVAPNAKVMAHIDEAPYIDGSRTPIKLAVMLEKYDDLTEEQKAWCDSLKTGFSNRQVPISQCLIDGETLPYCGGIEVVHTPGHTPGHICLFLCDSRIMVGGDAVNIADGRMTGPNPQHTYDMALGLKSFDKIKSFDMRSLVSYHCGYLEIKEV